MKPHFNPAYSLDQAAAWHGDRVAIHYGDVAVRVAEAAQVTRQLAGMLAGCGVGMGDRVALISRNSPYHLLLHVACARLGAVFVPVSFRFAVPELEDLLRFSGARVVVTDPETAVRGIDRAGCGGAEFFVIDDDAAASAADAPGEYRRLVASYSAVDPAELGDVLPDLADVESLGGAMLFTSGSTGRPKAVCLSHENLWWGSQNFREGFEYSNHDVELVTVPLTHIGGFNGTTLDLFSHGGTVVIVREFSPAVVVEQLERHKVAMMFAVPTIYAALMAHPDFVARDLSAFRLPLIGGAICPPALLKRMEEHGLRPLNVWGMTEAAASGFMLSQDLLDEARGAIGMPFAHVEAKIVGTDGNEAAEGELVISGPNVVSEYWKDPDFSAEAFRDGWLYTGDMARRDEHGFVWIVGRVRYQINTGGEKVIPEEVSNVLIHMPEISDAAVVGIPDPVWGQAVAAAIVLRPGFEAPSVKAVRDFAQAHIARFKAPRVLVVVDALPTNANGKINMAEVKELVLAGI